MRHRRTHLVFLRERVMGVNLMSLYCSSQRSSGALNRVRGLIISSRCCCRCCCYYWGLVALFCFFFRAPPLLSPGSRKDQGAHQPQGSPGHSCNSSSWRVSGGGAPWVRLGLQLLRVVAVAGNEEEEWDALLTGAEKAQLNYHLVKGERMIAKGGPPTREAALFHFRSLASG